MDGLRALDNMPISFPGLFGDWSWNPDRIAIHIGHGIYWYGIILAAAMLCGMYFAMKQAKRFGLTEDHIADLVLWEVPLCILGSRAYYVFFNLDQYRTASGALNWKSIVAVWDGGIAMYGTVLMGMLVAFLFTWFRKIPFGAMTDNMIMGLILGQAIGRWANLINREAFGRTTDLPWRMRLYVTAAQTADVHPTFLYESLWNLLGLLLMLAVVVRLRRFDGENTCFYFLWYGTGRFWIEGLRTDSLYLFNWTLFGEPIRVSQALSLVMVLVSALVLYYQLRIRKRTSDGLYVNRLALESTELPTESDSTETSTEADTVEASQEGDSVETPVEADSVDTVETPKEAAPTETPVEPDTVETPAEPDAVETSTEPDTGETPKEPDAGETTPAEANSTETSTEPDSTETSTEPDNTETPKEGTPQRQQKRRNARKRRKKKEAD